MQRGKKQSPFIGRRVPEVENGVPILYPRYTRLSEIIQGDEGSRKREEPEGAVENLGAGKDGKDERRPAKKHKSVEEQQMKGSGAVANYHAAAEDEEKLSKKDKKKLKREKKRQQQEVNMKEADKEELELQEGEGGPKEKKKQENQAGTAAAAAAVTAKGNAEEAQHIRQVFGFTGPVAKPAAGTSFAFSFEASKEQEVQEKLQRIPAVDGGAGGYVPRRVFVGGMPYHYTEEQIREYWGWCGEIEDLELMTFPDSGRFRGIAFITFASEEGYEAALACNGEQLEGQTLKVDKCKAAPAKKAKPHQQQQQQQRLAAVDSPAAANGNSSGPQKTPGYNVAYVGNIAFEVTPQELQELFAPHGVTKVRLHTDMNTGKSKGYAHVHFADEEGLEGSMALNGHELYGRGIRVSYGQPKKAAG